MQFARPANDISLGGWSGPAWSKLNEMVPDDDASYTEKTGSGTLEIGLSGVNDPGVRTGHVIQFRVKQQSGKGAKEKLLCELYDGLTKITEISSGSLTRGAYITVEHAIPEAEASLIVDYNLILKLIPTQGDTEVMRLTWAEIKIPDVVVEEHSGSGSISGNGSVDGTIKKAGRGSALKSAGGMILAVGLAGMLAIASIVGGGSQLTVGEKSATVGASISGNGSQLAAGRKSANASATVSGGGSIVAVGPVVESHSGVAVITGDGTLIASGTKSAEGSGEVSEGGIIGASAGGGAFDEAWLKGWTYRKEITVQDEFVDDDLTNFPLYVPIKADADFHEARADGYDIRFTLSDGKTLMKYEREHWAGGNGSPATAHFWVKIPSILADGGATIYVDYGKSDAPDGEDAPNVWDANFKAVWHMKDITPSTIADSTGILNGTKKAANEPIEAEGKVYKGQEFGGEVSRDYILTANSILLPGTCTYESWFKVNNFTSWAAVVSNLKHDTPASGFNIIPYHSSGYFKICAGNGVDYYVYKIFYPVPRLITGVLYHVAVTHDGTKFRLYINNVFQGEWIQALGQINQKFLMGRWAISYTSQYFLDSLVDEVRVSNIVRLPAWRKFGYHNINEADNELTWGSEEMVVSKYSSSKRTNSAIVKEVRPAGMKEVRFAGAREVRTPHVKTTRPSVGTFTRKG